MNYYNETDKYIFFWHGPFSNFWKTKIKIKDLEFLSTHKNKEVSKMATEYLLCYRKYNM